MDRRRFLYTTAAAASALTAGPALAQADNDSHARLDELFKALFQEDLRLSPEGATQLGLDKGPNADLRGKLRDESVTGRAAVKASTAAQLARLKAFPRESLSPADRINYDVVVYTRESARRVQAFDFGGAAFGPSPYVVSQLTGVYQSVPDFLDTKHKITSTEDADAYLSRMAAFAVQLDDQTAQMRHDAGLGVIPPDFICDISLTQMAAMHTAPEQSLLVTSIAKRAKDKGLSDRYAADAAKIYAEKISPALERQTAEMRRFRARAGHDASLRRLKDGEAFYAAALHAATTTNLTPDEVHKLGLEQGKEIIARMDEVLKTQGLTQGTVGDRVSALYKDPQYLYPNTDAGKAACIAYGNKRLAEITPELPRAFKRLPPYRFEVRRVPPQTEAGAASAFSQGPAIDGSRPGLVYINLQDTAEWPRFALSTTVFHEGLPGHQLEGGLALSNKDLPLIRKVGGFSSYAEGWALYAEQLADELGMYKDDPVGRVGYLKAQLFRCSRCVVDTGIHHMGWSREQAIAYFVQTDGDSPGRSDREVARYTSTPGQACSYKIGHTVWTRARTRAEHTLGPRYDIKDFHEAGLSYGRVPLDILDGVIDSYIKSKSA
ncbi:DUF885 family protein [Caulobacter sp. S45]|uniref:DUF885 domain-containing protein n=1 Tax=Caulobacter sp. S45 TaxID=1641861 RepID=UPI00131B5B74|nr:DUF885 family protein [Caulobacter sp. S45]